MTKLIRSKNWKSSTPNLPRSVQSAKRKSKKVKVVAKRKVQK